MADSIKNETLTGIKLGKEVEALRERLKIVEAERSERLKLFTAQEKLELSLRERVKELNCLYGVARLIEQNEESLEEIFKGVVSLLPISWQYPEITCAIITFKGKEYKSRNFRRSKWRQDAAIISSGNPAGMVEVYYKKKMPDIDEGPFLKEERLLINAVSERLGKAAQRIHLAELLEIEKNALKNANIALHDVLEKIQHEKKMIGSSIQENVDRIVVPIIYALEQELNPQQAKLLTLLRKNLEDIIAPFADNVMKSFSKLTPAEILVCNMVKNGLSSKEIARLKGISPDTVNRHREHIRRKLGLTNSKLNLVTYLSGLSRE